MAPLHRKPSGERSLLFTHALITLIIGIVLFRSLFVTNDGPVHLAFSHLLATDFSGVLQGQVYQFDATAISNLFTDLLMAPIERLASAQVAEATAQFLCLTLPAWGALFALRQIDRTNAWLSLVVYSQSVSQTLFLGLYNFCLSTSLFFFAIGFWLRFSRTGHRGDAIAVGVSLVLSYLTHVGGFIMAWAAIATLTGTRAVWAIWQNRSLRLDGTTRLSVYALATPLPLLAVLIHGQGHNPIAYGVRLKLRLVQFALLHPLAANPHTEIMARLVSATLLAGGLCCFWSLVHWKGPMTGRKMNLVLSAAVFTVVLGIMCAFPDVAGGGWTHFLRFMIYPYFAIVLALACLTYGRREALAASAAAVFAFTGLFASAITAQQVTQRELQPLAEVDRAIGTHCTVLPVILRDRPRDERQQPMEMNYSPYFQKSSALELHDDRVVLFNFLARLDVYPVRFRPGIEPQEEIFHWQPGEMNPSIQTLDIAAFEARAGLPVDYVLIWGDPADASAGLRTALNSALGGAALIFRAPNGLLTLYRRAPAVKGPCTAPAGE